MHPIILYGTIVVIVHSIVLALHSLAHEKIPTEGLGCAIGAWALSTLQRREQVL